MAKQNLSTEPYKGVRDFYPEDMAVQNYIFSTWKKVCEEFHYQEYAASLLEPAELYRSKGSDEIVNEQMFTFTDRGDREVALRPEMTPSLARMVAAQRKSLKFPLRWFTIANCFRYERPQRGRKREHWQLNADVMGIAGVEAEVEIISLAHAIMKKFGAKDEDFEIRINNRQLINYLIYDIFLNNRDDTWKKKWGPYLSRAIDRKDKIENEKFHEEVKTVLHDKTDSFLNLLGSKDVSDVKNALDKSEITGKYTESLEKLLPTLKNLQICNIRFDLTLMRGFDYYTGMVFEVFDTNPENRRALFGGGRYDNLLEMFGVEPVPTVGFGMGDVTIRDFLETHGLRTK